MAVTRRDDDYLICKHYYNHINDIDKDYEDFITFKHQDNHYFAWVHDGKVILRSEAYPDYERTVRGIKAIIKNRGIHERYTIDSQHGVHFLVLWGGGNHQKHTGNFAEHNEIGRSCPFKTKEELYAMMGFMGKDFVDKTFHYSKGSSAKTAAAAAAGAAALAASAKPKKKEVAKKKVVQKSAAAATASTTHRTATHKEASTSGGFKWWWLLPLLLLPLLFFLWKGCGTDKKIEKAAVTTPAVTTPKVVETAEVKTPEVDVEAEARLKAENEAKMKAERAAELKAEKEREAARVAAQKKAAREARQMLGNKSSNY